MVLRTSSKFDLWHRKYVIESKSRTVIYIYLSKVAPREDAGGLSREYVLRIPSVS